MRIGRQWLAITVGHPNQPNHPNIQIDQSNAEKGCYPHSYIESHWDDMYLGGRWSLPINSNPFYLLRGSKTCDAPNSYSNTGSIVSSMLRWGRKVRDYGLEVDGGCMSSFPYMVGGSRVPGVGRDEVSRPWHRERPGNRSEDLRRGLRRSMRN